MVKLTKIYTKTGDEGDTSLGNGDRTHKTDRRVETYGTVDEANAAIGLAVLAARRREDHAPIAGILERVQHDLFDVGADLATPVDANEAPDQKLRVIADQTQRLEREIDEANTRLAPLSSFVLPGGSETAASLHLARTVVRRAERLAAGLMEQQPGSTSPETVRYLNRLSDLLFVLARVANNHGADDVLWVPGANRGGVDERGGA